MIGPSRSAGARDALPLVRRCTALHAATLLLLLLRTRSCALGAEVFSQQLLLIFHLHLLWTCGAGSRGSSRNASANQIDKAQNRLGTQPLRDRILRLSVYLTLAFCDRVPSLRIISLVSV